MTRATAFPHPNMAEDMTAYAYVCSLVDRYLNHAAATTRRTPDPNAKYVLCVVSITYAYGIIATHTAIKLAEYNQFSSSSEISSNTFFAELDTAA